MPCMRVQLSCEVEKEKEQNLLSALSTVLADVLGKPEQYVMVVFDTSAILMSGKSGPAAFVEVRSIGKLNAKINAVLSQKVCRLLNEYLGISPARVFLNFTDVSAENWGWNNQTFG